MLPVEKKADCRRKRKNREMRRSASVRVRWVRTLLRSVFVGEVVVMTTPLGRCVSWLESGDLLEALVQLWCWWMACSRRTHVRSVEQKVKKNRPSYEIVRSTKQGEKVRKIMTKRWR